MNFDRPLVESLSVVSLADTEERVIDIGLSRTFMGVKKGIVWCNGYGESEVPVTFGPVHGC